ncbi:unnamed protein product [Paramecium sonneborni]|uniref:Uncharacterized protein n=1 Tax=Paramecium sonneborni TaxID=65129 RepID=A0A8S1L4N9_9CILI|nr:unnamed protein product [Paramecium sonneborni]
MMYQFSRLEKTMIELFKFENLQIINIQQENLKQIFKNQIIIYYNTQQYKGRIQQRINVYKMNRMTESNIIQFQQLSSKSTIISYGTLITYNSQLDHILEVKEREYKQNMELQIQVRQKNLLEVANGRKNNQNLRKKFIMQTKSLIKLTLTCQSEQNVDEIFTYLMTNKSKLQIESAMMQSVDYLEDFKSKQILRNVKLYKQDVLQI